MYEHLLVQQHKAYAYWPLDDASGSPVDRSGNARNLTVAGTLDYRVPGPSRALPYAVGMDGDSLTQSSLNLATLGVPFSFGLWVRPSAAGALDDGIMGDWESNTGLMIYLRNANELTVQWNGDPVVTGKLGAAFAPGYWHFLVISVDSNRVYTLYRNGEPYIRAVGQGAIGAGSSGFRIASYAFDPSSVRLQCRAAGAFVLDHTLSQSDVRALYRAARPLAV